MNPMKFSVPSSIPHGATLVLMGAVLCACSSVEPSGPLKAVMEGKIFDEGPPRDPVQEKKDEEGLRQLHQQTPPTEDTGGPVRFKIPL